MTRLSGVIANLNTATVGESLRKESTLDDENKSKFLTDDHGERVRGFVKILLAVRSIKYPEPCTHQLQRRKHEGKKIKNISSDLEEKKR